MNLYRKTIKYFTNKLTPIYKRKLEEQLIKEFDTNEGNLILEKLLEREPVEKLRTMLFKKVFPIDFKNMPDERRRFEVYARIAAATSILNLFKARYTRAYEAFINAKNDADREQLRGRILECSNIIDQALLAPNILADWDNYKKSKEEKSNKISKYFNT